MAEILKSILILCLIGINILAFGQNEEMQDVLFLKNGKTINGYILSTDSLNIKIVEYGSKLIIVKESDIMHHEKQPLGRITPYDDKLFKPNVYKSQIELSFAKGTYNRSFTSIRYINGYKFKNKNFVGIGIGVTIHHPYYGNLVYLAYRSYPIFLRYSYDILSKRNTPYFFSDIGSQFQPNEDKQLKPLFFRIGFGNKFTIKKSNFYTSIDYTYNNARFKYDYQSQIGYSYWYRNHMAAISIGWQFN